MSFRRVPPALAVMVLLASVAGAGELTPGLESYLAQKRSDDPVRALVVLRDQVDVLSLDLDLHLRGTDLATRHVAVITELREKAAATQGPLLAALDRRLGREVEAYRAYWLINAVRVSGSEAAIRALAARDDVAVAELDLVVEPVAAEATAARSELRGIGITPGMVAVGARRVWDELGIRGEGALIGSLDTGVDGNHPALAGRWRGNHAPWQECWLDVLGGGTSYPVDSGSHGTHTTGTMVGLAPDDTIGVAPAAEWIAANAIGQGAGPLFDADILACLQFFADPDGDPGTLDDVPDVVQNSWGINENFVGYFDCDSRWWTAIDACEAAGVMLCWSAGNEGPNPQTLRSPADRATTLYNGFSVGSTEATPPYIIASSSSRGPAGPDCGPVENRTKPEIVAPGKDIYSSVPGGGYAYYSGTSMAGPHVAGVAALMRSANPDLDVITIKQILMATAQDLGDPGEDNTYGHGFLDAYEAVAMVMGDLGWVEGIVRDADSGLPVGGATVSVEGTAQASTTGPDGFYRFTLPAGPATLEATAFGYLDASFPVTIVDGETVQQDLVLERAGTARLAGVVHRPGFLPPDQAPAEGAVVRVADTPLAPETTGPDGRFEFWLPSGGDYRLQATLTGEGSLQQIVPVGDTDQAIDLYLSALASEDFETGDFGALPWITGGNQPWFVQNSDSYEGLYAARSGNIGNLQQSSLEISLDGGGGTMSFFYRVSSEQDYDYLRFYVDGALQEQWSGNTGWLPHTLEVPPGEHTFRWVYVKDQYVSYLHDAAWIDAIVFPGGATAAPVAVAAPWTLDYGELEQGASAARPLLVMDQGQEPLAITTTAAAPWVSVSGGAGTIDPHAYGLAEVAVDATGLPAGMHQTWVHVDSNDPANPRISVEIRLRVTDDLLPVEDLPRRFALLGAVPNPFNPATTIRFLLPAAGHVDLRLYDLQGRLVRELVSEVRPGGPGEARWDGRDRHGRAVASGTYFARLQHGGQRSVTSLVLVR